MAEEKVGNPPSVSKKLIKQWRWVAIAVVIVALAVVSKRADIDLSNVGQSDHCQVEVTADVLNVRAGPDINSASVEKLNRGQVIDAQPETTNNFRKLGENRWVSLEFVKSSSACDAQG